MNLDNLSNAASTLAVTYGVRVIGVLFLLLAGWIMAAWAGRMSCAAFERAKLDKTLAKFAGKIARWVVLLLVLLASLGIFGVETTSFAAVLGAGGLAIGLALQGTLSNFAAGMMLLMLRYYKAGDKMLIGGQLAIVDEIDLFSTILNTPDNRRIIVPNGSIFGSIIENHTHNPTRRVDIPVGISYQADIDATRKILLEAAHQVTGVLTDPEPAAVVLGFGASSVDWSVRVWTNTEEYLDVKQAAVREIKIALDEASIEIPFPQMDVHIEKI